MKPICRPLVLVLLASLLGPPPSGANSLYPSHPVWAQNGVSVEAFGGYLRDLQTQPGRLAIPGQDRLARRAPLEGSPRILVVPVLWPGLSDPPVSREDLEAKIFGSGEGSLRGYYDFVSGGRFVPEGDVLPWIRMDDGLSLYANVVDGRPRPAGPAALVGDLLPQLEERFDSLGAWDNDGPDGIAGSGDDDGIVDFLLVIHAMDGFENGASPALSMLAHRGRARSEARDRIDAYALASWRGPLGVWAHEFAHLLGLEDLYDLGSEENPPTGGVGDWSLMASGAWGGNGRTPSHLDPLSRHWLGWDAGPSLMKPAITNLRAPDATGAFSVQMHGAGPWGGERWYAEDRMPRPGAIVDAALPGSGILVWGADLHAGPATMGSPWLRLLQADGRTDLEDALNLGDAGDPFPRGGGAQLNSTSSPATFEGAIPEGIQSPRIDPATALAYWPAERPYLALEEAFFVDTNSGDRSWIRPGETADWQLRFESLGPELPTTASLSLASLDTGLSLVGTDSFDLLLQGQTWRPATAPQWRESSLAMRARGAAIEFRLAVDGVSRPLDFALPVQSLGGMGGKGGASYWESSVTAGATSWEILGLTELPKLDISGFTTQTLQPSPVGYARDSELQLEGPWFGTEGELFGFLSQIDAEERVPGEYFDAGLVEWRSPGGRWQPLRPEGADFGRLALRSGIPAGGEPALGGNSGGWRRISCRPPEQLRPIQLRLRFLSDGSVEGDGWQVAGMSSESENLPRASLLIERSAEGRPRAVGEVLGAFGGYSTLRFYSRNPGGEEWVVASSAISISPDRPSIRTLLILPAGPREVGLFAEVTGAPPVWLASAPWAGDLPTAAGLRVSPNPASGEAYLYPSEPWPGGTIRIHDLRGRLVRILRPDVGAVFLRWNLQDESGARVAAGAYHLLMPDQSLFRISVFP